MLAVVKNIVAFPWVMLNVQFSSSRHKNDPVSGLCSDHAINGTNDLLAHIMRILNAAMVHGILPENCLQSTIIPIPKGKNANVTDSANCCGIALNSVLSKIFDNIILHRHIDRLSSSELQFGFKAEFNYHVHNGIKRNLVLLCQTPKLGLLLVF